MVLLIESGGQGVDLQPLHMDLIASPVVLTLYGIPTRRFV
jgi:hypothetical protein